MIDEASAAQLRALVEKGAIGCGVFETADVAGRLAGTGSASSSGRAEPYRVAVLAAVKMDFGTMQWTPLRTSTTWLMRQSAAIEARE